MSSGWAAVAVLRSIVLWVAAIVGAACIVLFLAAILFGIRPQSVISGSMTPFMPTGSLVLVRDAPASDLKVGEVITVPRPNGEGLITHRIVAITPAERGYSVVLRGDANAADDPQPYTIAHAGRVLVVIPGVGFIAELLRTPFGIGGVVLVALALIAAYAVPQRRGG
ncbi:signal peptidase I [Leifsonia sp. NPDC058292]|uniref:signal peptidase I n=1 Tax=Leifsonia sp. NPDC058292 TaxID=3346428 RepID=UPI0036D99A39